MRIINLIPGSPEWLQSRSASKSPAMMGDSNYQTRTELIVQMATGITQDIDPATQARFDSGHRTEALSRVIAEEIIDDALSPISASDDDGYLTANYDGITFSSDVGYEHKDWNEKLAESVLRGVVPNSHAWQLDQQILVGKLDYVLFVVSNGTREKFVYLEYHSDKERAEALMAGWRQFDIDLAEYKRKLEAGEIEHVKEKPIADAMEGLPALFVQVRGEITAHNMEAFGESLKISLANTRSIVLTTDQDYSNAEAAAKLYRETCKKLVLVKEAVLAQATTIGEATRIIDDWHEDLRVTALQLEKDVKENKDAKKLAIITRARMEYIEYVTALELEIKPIRLSLDAPEFAAALKGRSLISAWHNAANTLLANSKIKADAAAKDMREKLAWCKESSSGFGFLLNDLAQIIVKPLEDFKLLVTSRIEAHKVAEAAKLELERERIRVEEEAKAKAKIESEERGKALAAYADQREAEDKASAQAEAEAKAKLIQDDLQRVKDERAKREAETVAVSEKSAEEDRGGSQDSLQDGTDISPTTRQAKQVVNSLPTDDQVIRTILEKFNLSYANACEVILATAENMRIAA
jgi:predicted phage-related endonuclease